MLEDTDKDWISEQIKANTQYSQRVVGDLPTDANQLTNKRYVNTFVASGYVDSSGKGVFLPQGWSSAGAGAVKTVTHNLGSTNYIVVVTVLATGFNRDYTAVISDYSANSFDVNVILSGLESAQDFFFILVRQNY